MSDWDGSRWVDPTPRASEPSRTARWAATVVMILGLALVIVPLSGVAAGSRRSAPTLSVGCAAECRSSGSLTVGSSLMVRGSGFTPSAGGQQVILFIEYPDDSCGANGCHGFYVHPWVNGDGSFSAAYDGATVAEGVGGVKATQYNARTDKWVNVAYVDYTVD